MYDVEDLHWWYVCLRRRIINEIVNSYGSKLDIHILDAGCGTGGLMKELLSRGYQNVEGFDFSVHAVKYCRMRGLDVINASIEDIDKAYAGKKFDVIISSDVLYFVPENERRDVANRINSLLTVQGIVIMNLPAFKAFSGSHDKAVGINRRFEKKDIREIFSINKYNLLNVCYWPLYLSPLIFTVRWYQRMISRLFNYSKPDSDIELPILFVNNILLWFACMDKITFCRPRIGSSMLVTVKNNATHI